LFAVGLFGVLAMKRRSLVGQNTYLSPSLRSEAFQTVTAEGFWIASRRSQ
jgi:hypothetical protein